MEGEETRDKANEIESRLSQTDGRSEQQINTARWKKGRKQVRATGGE